ncbi:MAG: cold shock domain-containing protein [Methylophilaceae bacterium]
MRFQGKITRWQDHRGFGFITPNGSGEDIFLHISDLDDSQRPSVGGLVTYTIGENAKGKKAMNVQFVVKKAPIRERKKPSSFNWFKWIKPVVIAVVILCIFRAHIFEDASKPVDTELFEAQQTPLNTNTFQCNGRTQCSEMTSCEEAKFYLKHCPSTKMDGDQDGIPCESQWCRS